VLNVTSFIVQDGTKEEKSDKDSASKDGKVEKPDGKPAGKDGGKEKGAKDAKEKGNTIKFSVVYYNERNF
jgi:hypothetical protein